MNINYKKLIAIIAITFIIGGFFTFFINSRSAYDGLIKPDITPPAIVFPMVWSILYLLMSISLYIISESDSNNKTKSYILYFTQLIVNSLWTLISFGLNLKLLSFIWIIILFVLVLWMTIEFYKINKVAAYLQIPYLIWLVLAAYLSFNIYLLN